MSFSGRALALLGVGYGAVALALEGVVALSLPVQQIVAPVEQTSVFSQANQDAVRPAPGDGLVRSERADAKAITTLYEELLRQDEPSVALRRSEPKTDVISQLEGLKVTESRHDFAVISSADRVHLVNDQDSATITG